MDCFTVSEVAAMTGFSSSALRYYDELGLVRPVARSEAGYRLYDDRSVELLRFISRAKRLKLTLNDITDLVALWDDDDCAPVQSRLAGLVAAKLADTRRAIVDLNRFASQLSELSGRLTSPAHAGACDDICACNAVPAVDDSVAVPVVCDVSTAPDTLEQRMESYRQLFADALVGRDRTVAGNRFRFIADDGVEDRVRHLADLEKQCCAFFDFTITVAGGEVLWDTTVIDDDIAWAVLDEWFHLPDTVGQGVEVVRDRMVASGLQFSAVR
jgi:DNA-binding transcriptional MerR regulator